MQMKGIELSSDQKAQLKELRERQRTAAEQGKGRALREQARSARERGDTSQVRRIRSEFESEMKQRHERMLSAVRAILTPAQREVFDRNVAEMQQRYQQGRRNHERRS